MRFLRRRRERQQQQRQGSVPEEPAGGNQDSLRQGGEALFQAADDAINRALSGDSLAFLQATRQEGGQ